MKNLFIPVIHGTSRRNSQSINVAKLIFEILKQYEDVDSVLIGPQDFNLPFDGNDTQSKDIKYTQLTQKADGLFIVTPEYNHSFPGSLKRMLDSEYQNYKHKPIAFAGVSSGPWGGVRAIEALVNCVRELGLIAISKDVCFPKTQDLFDDRGNLLEQDYIKKTKSSLDELIWMAKVLKNGREDLS